MRVCGNDRLFLCEGPLGEKAFVGKDSCSRGMIDGDQPSLVYKVHRLHRLAEAKTEESVTRMQLIAVHLDPFVGVRNICARTNIPDPDEWIKVDGDQLHARNGLFSLRFGEPMEAVNFVDQTRLVAIDHPAGTTVFPNEGFLSERPFAKEKTIVAADAHPLAGAWDDHGNNVLDVLSQHTIDYRETRNYVRDFTNLPFAGFANLHSLTIDIGTWSPQRPLRLLLHGFIEYFSASTMYSAWQAGLSPIPPYVEAQMPDGSWRKIVDDM